MSRTIPRAVLGAAALVAIATARLVPGNWYIVAGGLVGSCAGAVVETMKARRHVA